MPAESAFQIKITLLGSRPPIWRRLVVPDMILDELHGAIQIAMGWTDSHLHEFHQRREPAAPGARLSQLLTAAKAKIGYTYDFGDGWEHEIVLEKRVAHDGPPVCTAGKRSGPPEDCGGIYGYEDLLVAIGDPAHEDHKSMLEWLGGSFDPEALSLDEINEQLRRRFPARNQARRKTAPRATRATVSGFPLDWLYGSPEPEKKRIGPEDTVPVELSERDRRLILEHTFAEDDLTDRLRLVPRKGQRPLYRYTLDDLEDLAGYVAAESNHAKDRKLGKELLELHSRLMIVLDSYTDED
jgi:hypothetical protein